MQNTTTTTPSQELHNIIEGLSYDERSELYGSVREDILKDAIGIVQDYEQQENICDLFNGFDGIPSNNYDEDVYIFEGIDEVAEVITDPAELARAVFYGDANNIEGTLMIDVYGHVTDSEWESQDEYLEWVFQEDIMDAFAALFLSNTYDEIASLIQVFTERDELDTAKAIAQLTREITEKVTSK